MLLRDGRRLRGQWAHNIGRFTGNDWITKAVKRGLRPAVCSCKDDEIDEDDDDKVHIDIT